MGGGQLDARRRLAAHACCRPAAGRHLPPSDKGAHTESQSRRRPPPLPPNSHLGRRHTGRPVCAVQAAGRRGPRHHLWRQRQQLTDLARRPRATAGGCERGRADCCWGAACSRARGHSNTHACTFSSVDQFSYTSAKSHSQLDARRAWAASPSRTSGQSPAWRVWGRLRRSARTW